ncbi:hypothetical protein N9Y42_09785 [Mariniblastus sp.]|nr:hypothetical protein [Mariniblastus sp.]
MTNNQNDNSLPLSNSEAVPDVPTFACLIYLSRDEEGRSHARVANLDSLRATAATPRDAMARVCREFKQRVRAAYAAGEKIDWIEPVEEPGPDEQVRSIPVHL